MKLELFPPAYKQTIKDQAQQQITTEKKRSSERQSNIKNNVSKAPEGATWILGTGIVGFVIGFFVCVTEFNDRSSEITLDEVVFELWRSWLIWTVVGLALGIILFLFIKAIHSNNINNMQEEIKNEESHTKQNCDRILRDVDKEYAQYLKEFESESQKMSVNFAESQLAIEVIEWMTNGFVKTIDAADRRTHIPKIEIPFNFHVYKNKIVCNLGTYDFEIKRCRNLKGPLEQTALARAIASAIQLNITMKYSQDISGTSIITNTVYTYEQDYVSASIIYTAQNGNYRAVRDWN